MPDRKPSNAPNLKEAVGQTKVPVDLCPDTALIEWAFAQMEGALKYGRYNWRIAGVRCSTYIAAAERHLKKFKNGQDRDPTTTVHELGSVMACCAILLDAWRLGLLNDDRPPRAPVAEILDSPEVLKRVAHLKELFKDYNPRQWTIADSDLSEADRAEANGGGGVPPAQ